MTEPFDYRSKEKAEILRYISKSINTFVFGPNGVGKTALIKAIVEEVNCRFGQALYVDCSLYQTANAVLREILLSLGSVIASKSNYELTKRLKEKTKKTKLFIFLDHFENLKKHDVLNILLGLNFCICLVADSLESYRFLNFNLRAKFANMMRIERFSDDRVSEILREMANNRTGDEIIKKIVEKSMDNLTLALNRLKIVEANPGKSACTEQIDFNDRVAICNEYHSIILDILKQRNRLPSGELYRIYSEKSEYPKSERSFRKYMEALCKQGLVKSIGEKRGRIYEITETSEENHNA